MPMSVIVINFFSLILYNRNMTDKAENTPREQKAKTFRVLQVARLIRTLPYPNITKLAKETGASKRTIARDLDTLRDDYYAPIEYDHFHKGFHYTDDNFDAQKIIMAESELIAIAGLLPMLERYKNTPLEDAIKNAYTSLCDMLPKQIQVQSDFLSNIQFISEAIPKIEPDVFSAIIKAIKNHKTIEFDYRSLSATEHTPHTADPYQIYNHKGDWYVICYNEKHANYIPFTLARMKNVILKDPFNIRPNFEKEINIDPHFGIWNNNSPAQNFKFLFDKAINTYIIEREWHKNQKIEQNPDGSGILSFESNQYQEVKFWTLRFVIQIKVLEPESLKLEIQEEYKKALNLYL